MIVVKTARGRRGVLLIAVLVTLTLLISLFGYWIRIIVLEQRQMRVQQNALQAELLAESGLERAAARLATESDYAGETWRIDTAQLSGRGEGQVQIEITPVPDQPSARAVRVSADYPVEGVAHVRRQRTLQINLPSPGGSP